MAAPTAEATRRPVAPGLDEAFLRLAERSFDAVVVTCGDDRRIVYANPAYAELVGMKAASLVGGTLPVSGAEGDLTLLRGDGAPLTVTATADPLTQGPAMRLWTLRPRRPIDGIGGDDMDPWGLLDLLPQAVVLFDPDDRFLYCNRAYRQIMAGKADLLVPGTTFEEICRAAGLRGHLSGVDAEGVEAWVAERMARHNDCGPAFEEVMRDGRVLLTYEVRLADGGILGIRSDITDQRRRQIDLLDSLSDGFAIFDDKDRLFLWNRRYADFCNEIEDVLQAGATFEAIVRARAQRGHYELGDDLEETVRRRMERHREGRGETVLRLADGRWLLARDRRAADGSHAVGATDVTAIKEAEEAARRSEERFATLLEASSDWYWETDAEHRLTRIERGAEMFGEYRVEQMIGRQRWELDQDATPAHVWERYKEEVAARRPLRNFRFARWRDDGRTHHYAVSGKPVYDEAGRFLGYRGTGSDVTAEVEAERRAASAQSLLETAVESLAEGIAVFDRDDRLVMVNGKWREIHAAVAEHLHPGLPFADHVRLFLEAGMVSDAAGREAEWLHWRSKVDSRDGTKHIRRFAPDRWMIVADYRTADGLTVCVRTDITEIKRNEERLAELAMIAERTDNAVMTTDPDARITWINEGFTRMTGFTFDDLRDRTPFDTFLDGPEIDLDAVAAILASRAAGRSYESEHVCYRKDGSTLWVHVSGTPIRGEDGSPIKWLTVARDVTRQRQATLALSEARDAAERASTAKSAFLANMSHELRTPLNAIIGFSEVMMHETFGALGSERYRQYAEGIHQSGSHLLGLINDILDFSKAGAGLLRLDEQTVDGAAVVAEAAQVMRARADHGGVDLVTEVPEGPALLRADPRKLKQILLNLLSNAIKFTAAGGRVTLSLRLRPGEDVLLEVRDTGIGMAPEDIPNAFVAFGQIDNRLNRHYDGTGLGLPLTLKLVELHGGSIALDSAPGYGTTATVRLPAKRVVAAPSR